MKTKQKGTIKVAGVHLGKALSRRTMLKGVGAALALPMLDAMTPAFANAPQAVHRFQTVYSERHGHGILEPRHHR